MTEFKNTERELYFFRIRLFAIAGFILLCFTALFARFVWLQIVKHEVYATQAENTVRKIAAAYGIPSSWEAILKANPYISSGEKSLTVGSAVKIPLTAYRQVPA